MIACPNPIHRTAGGIDCGIPKLRIANVFASLSMRTLRCSTKVSGPMPYHLDVRRHVGAMVGSVVGSKHLGFVR